MSARPFRRVTQKYLWVVLGVLIIGAAVAITALQSPPGQPLDPRSPSHSGSKALATLLSAHGTHVHAIDAMSDALASASGSTIVVAAPDDLSAAQLSQLAASGHRLVVVAPSAESLAAVAPDRQLLEAPVGQHVSAQCGWPGAIAAGPLDLPADSVAFSGTDTCYSGAVVVTDQLVLLGSSGFLRNDMLATGNTAALAMNAISTDGTAAEVTWLLPGADAAGPGAPTLWELFPPWTQRAFWLLLVVGGLVALWRGRRLGPVVAEPLPVVVHAAEVVEGHGRLYQRAMARDQASAALRAGTRDRLRARLGISRLDGFGVLVEAVSARSGRAPGAVASLLDGPVPQDDAALVRLAAQLDAVEADLSGDPLPAVKGQM